MENLPDELVDLMAFEMLEDHLEARVFFSLTCKRFLRGLDVSFYLRGKELFSLIVLNGSIAQFLLVLDWFGYRKHPEKIPWHSLSVISSTSRFRDPPSKGIMAFLKENYITNNDYNNLMSADGPQDSHLRAYYFHLGRTISLEEASEMSRYFPEGALFNSIRMHPTGSIATALLCGAAFQGNEMPFALMLTFSPEIYYGNYDDTATSILDACLPYDRYECYKIFLEKMANDFQFPRDLKYLIRIPYAREGCRILKDHWDVYGHELEPVLFRLVSLYQNGNFEAMESLLTHPNLEKTEPVSQALAGVIRSCVLTSNSQRKPQVGIATLLLRTYSAATVETTQIENLFNKDPKEFGLDLKFSRPVLDLLWKELLFPRLFCDPKVNSEAIEVLLRAASDPSFNGGTLLPFIESMGYKVTPKPKPVPVPVAPLAPKEPTEENEDFEPWFGDLF